MTDAPAAVPIGDYRKVLRKVGLALIVVGLLDIGWMVYCLTRWWSYSSSLNIFAVIAGVLLVRGNLKAARVVALYSAFGLTVFAVGALAVPVATRLPLELAWLCLRLYPLPVIGFLLFLLALFVLLAWTYRTLTRPAVLAAMDQQQVSHRHWRHRPSSGFASGALLLVIVFGVSSVCLRGTKQQAEEEARRRVGPGYRLYASGISISSAAGGLTVVHADVIAYNDHEIRTVPVEFERR